MTNQEGGAVAPKVGFVGLGEMGAPMAERLVRAGFSLSVFDTRPEPVKSLVEIGAKTHQSAGDLAAHSDVICVCVTLESDVERVLLADDGLLAGARPGTVIAVHSSATTALLQFLDARTKVNGVLLLDAPISGARASALNGTLCAMVGGDAEALAVAEPVLSAYANRICHLGSMGAGQLAKLLNNNLLFANMTLAMSARELAGELGLSLSSVDLVLQASSGSSFGLNIVQSDYELNRMAAAAVPSANERSTAISDHITHLQQELTERNVQDSGGLLAYSAVVAQRSQAHLQLTSRPQPSDE